MDSAANWVPLLDWATVTTSLAVQWLVQSTLVIAAGLAAAALLRGRSSAMRSVIYQTTLVVALACPLVAYVLSSAGLTFVTLRFPSPHGERVEEVPLADSAATSRIEAVAPYADEIAESETSEPVAIEPVAAPRERFDAGLPPQGERAFQPPTGAPASIAAAPAARSTTPTPERAAVATRTQVVVTVRPVVAAVAVAISLGWLATAMMLTGRLLAEYWQLARVRRTAASVDQGTAQLCAELARRMQVRPPLLLRSPLVTSPCLAGILRPAIVLPEDLSGPSLSAVLVHELAHRKRRDCAWNLLRQLGQAVLWPQPLVWWLSRQIEVAAEEVCDDYVVNFGESRAAYAEVLVSLAEQNLLPGSAAVVSLVTFRSLLAERVRRIMDHSRRLSLAVGLSALSLIVAGGMSAALVAGLLGPGRANISPSGPREQPSQQATAEPPSATPPATDTIVVRGTVLDPDGNPAAGVSVRCALIDPSDIFAKKKVLSTTTDAAGRYAIDTRLSRDEIRHWPPSVPLALAVTTAPGHGLAWQQLTKDKLDRDCALQLVADRPIEGRVVDLEAQPIAGVDVRVTSIEATENGGLAPWLAALRGGASYLAAADRNPIVTRLGVTRYGYPVEPDLIGVRAQTDAVGRFRLDGIGQDRMAYVRFSGGGVVVGNRRVVNAEIEPVHVSPASGALQDMSTIYGARFECPVERSSPIEGVVRDAESGEPLAGVRIVSNRFAGSRLVSHHVVETTSGPDGRYRLEGMPHGKGNQILAVPTSEQPYIMRELDVPTSEPFQPVRFDVELHRGVWIEGRVTDAETGEPVAGHVSYVPWPDNPNLDGVDELTSGDLPGPQDHYRAGADGSFRLPGLPGRGLVVFWRQVNLGRPTGYPNGQGVHQIADLPSDEAFHKTTSILAPRSSFVTAVAEVRAEPGDTATVANIKLEQGDRIAVRILDPDGQPLGGARVRGLWPVGQFHEFENLGSDVEVAGLAKGESRQIVIDHPQRGLGKGIQLDVERDGHGPIEVRLEPTATITGRLLDNGGDPLRNIVVNVQYKAGPKFVERLDPAHTDADGRFTCDAVPPGVEYSVQSEERVKYRVLAEKLTPAAGETIDLGDIDALSDKRPEPRRMAASESPSPAKASATGVAQTAQDTASDDVEFAGKVIGPDGQPMAGAKVALDYIPLDVADASPVAETDAEGQFLLRVARRSLRLDEPAGPWPWVNLVASLPGYGFAWRQAWHFEKTGQLAKDVESRGDVPPSTILLPSRVLELVEDDVPIEGRVINLEGQPASGVTVDVAWVSANREKSLDPWLKIVEVEKQSFYRGFSALGESYRARDDRTEGAPFVPHAVTDADGRFRLEGLGRERLVRLRIAGQGYETRLVYARTRAGQLLRVENEAGDPETDYAVCYGANMEYAIAPAVPVVGVVRDRATKQPLAGVKIAPDALPGVRVHGVSTHGYIHATTDADGRYRLAGLPIGKSTLVALPGDELPYVLSALDVETDPSKESVTLDFELVRGVRIRGRAFDGDTGEAVRGEIQYFAFSGNPNLEAPGTMQALNEHATTNKDGRFELIGLPGRGLVTLLVHDSFGYPRGIGAEMIAGGRESGSYFMYRTRPYLVTSANATILAEINPSPGTEAIDVDLELHKGVHIKGQVVDADGKPLSGATIAGHGGAGWDMLPKDTFTVRKPEPGQPRRVIFYHAARKLSGTILVGPDDQGPLVARLEPWGAVTGRMVLSNGDPAERVRFTGGKFRDRDDSLDRGALPRLGLDGTDVDGRFTIEGLVPGLRYTIGAVRGSRYLGVAVEDVTIASGETKNLGDVTILSEVEAAVRKAKQLKPATNNTTRAAAPDRVQFAGQVVLPFGKPAGGAKVYLLQDAALVSDPLAETVTRADGSFAFDVAKSAFDAHESSEPWLVAKIAAKAEGLGMAWALAPSFDPSGAMAKRIPLYPNLSKRDSELVGDGTLRLVPDDVPVEGRVVSIEGQPVAGAQVRVISIARPGGQNLDDWQAAVQDKQTAFHQAWKLLEIETGFNCRRQVETLFGSITTGADGRFQIVGLGRESIATLQIEGPGIETRQVSARTRGGEAIHVVDPRWPDQQADIYYGASFDHVAGPSRPVRGIVRDKDTGQTLAGTRIQAYRLAGAGVQPYPNAMFFTLSDAEGRYELRGLPVGENELLAIGPPDEPYLVSALPAEINPADAATTVDFALKKGVWIRGRVTDAGDGRPLRANVEYSVFLDNPYRREAPGYSDAFSLWYPTDGEGRFQLPGFAGRGIVGVRAANYSDYPKGVGADKIEGLQSNGGTTYFRTDPHIVSPQNYHALAAVNPDASGANNECDFALVRGRVVAGTVLDPSGKPLAGVQILGAVEGRVWQRLDDASFSVRNVDPASPRLVQFFHAKRKLAGSALVKGDEAEPLTVTLAPAATVTGRIVDARGDTLEGARISSDSGADNLWGALPEAYDFAVDGDGRFTIAGLAPDLPYHLRVHLPIRSLGMAAEDLRLTSGETRDLGELAFKRPVN